MGDWRIAVADDEERSNLISTVVDTPKEKAPRTLFWKNRCGEHTQAMSLTRMFNQVSFYPIDSVNYVENPNEWACA